MSITAVRTLPGRTSPLWDNPRTVADIAGVELPLDDEAPPFLHPAEVADIVAGFLAGAGRTAAQVAQTLAAAGVGHRHSAAGNPVVRWLAGFDEFGPVSGVDFVGVIGHAAPALHLTVLGADMTPEQVLVMLPAPVARFLAAFDAGWWPALLDRAGVEMSAVAA